MGEVLGARYFSGPNSLGDISEARRRGTLDKLMLFRSSDFERTKSSGVEVVTSVIK